MTSSHLLVSILINIKWLSCYSFTYHITDSTIAFLISHYYRNHIDVAHYTGPSKPWVPNSPIEDKAIQPWLAMMKQEGLALPEQLPKEPSKNLFVVLTSARSGSEWLMGMLDQHPQVCASGEASKPEMGFPTEAMLSRESWLPTCSMKKGCTLHFVLDGVAKFTEGGTVLNPPQCQEGAEFTGTNSNIEDGHRQRICNFVDALDGDFSKEAIVRKYTVAFADEDKRFLG